MVRNPGLAGKKVFFVGTDGISKEMETQYLREAVRDSGGTATLASESIHWTPHVPSVIEQMHQASPDVVVIYHPRVSLSLAKMDHNEDPMRSVLQIIGEAKTSNIPVIVMDMMVGQPQQLELRNVGASFVDISDHRIDLQRQADIIAETLRQQDLPDRKRSG